MTNLATIKFGTDGWRAVIARDYTFANVERVAQAYADYLLSNQRRLLGQHPVDVKQISGQENDTKLFSNVVGKAIASAGLLVVVGYDRRFLSELFAKRAAQILVGNNFSVALFNEAAPTPLISWAVKEL